MDERRIKKNANSKGKKSEETAMKLSGKRCKRKQANLHQNFLPKSQAPSLPSTFRRALS